jgi:HSP20 family protein
VSPFSVVRRMMEDMERMFAAPFSSSLLPGFWPESGGGFGSLEAGWNPQVEVFERGDQLVVRADLPGMDKKDVRLECTPDGLLIEGERKDEREERDRGFYRSERTYGSFQRLIPLPEGIDYETANAQMKDGVLEISFKTPDQGKQRRRIEIGEGKQGGEGPKSVH